MNTIFPPIPSMKWDLPYWFSVRFFPWSPCRWRGVVAPEDRITTGVSRTNRRVRNYKSWIDRLQHALDRSRGVIFRGKVFSPVNGLFRRGILRPTGSASERGSR